MCALPVSHLGDPDENLGAIRNHLQLLSADFHYFFPKQLLKIYPNATDLADLLGIQRTQLYLKHIPLKAGTKLKKRIIQIAIATDLAYDLLGQSQEKTLHWLTAPSLVFFGDSPLDVIMRDEAEAVIGWLLERSGLKQGYAF